MISIAAHSERKKSRLSGHSYADKLGQRLKAGDGESEGLFLNERSRRDARFGHVENDIHDPTIAVCRQEAGP